MTTTTPDRTATARATFVAAAERRATSAVTWNLVGATWWIGAWFWAIYVAVLALQAAVPLLSGDTELRSAAGSFTAPWIFLFVMGIVLLAQMSRLHLVAGGTRRTLVHGEWRAAAIIAVTFGAAGWLLLALVDLVVRALGHDVRPVDGILVTSGSGTWFALLAHVLASGVLFTTGILVGHVYRRLGGWRGTLALPLTLLPAAVALAAFEVAAGDGPLVLDAPAWLVVLIGGAVGWLVAAWSTWLVVRSAPVE